MAGSRDSTSMAYGSPRFDTGALAALLSGPPTPEQRMADSVRALALDAVSAAGSGDAALPMAMADVAAMLWARTLRFDASDPRWPDRDRFVLAAGSGSVLLYALLHLTGHDGMTADDLRRFRQLDSPASGHPELHDHPAIEATTGPRGQGVAMGVGFALAERMMAARFGRSLVDHRTWVVASESDLAQGIVHEAASIAGQLRLEKLTVLLDAPGEGAEDALRRFTALGWATKKVDGHDPAAIGSALSLAIRSRKPTLIACQTTRGAGVNGSAEDTMGWAHPAFEVPPDLQDRWQAAGRRGTTARRGWLKRLTRHPLRPEFERAIAGRLPDSWHEALATLKAEMAEQRPAQSTRHSAARVQAALTLAIPELVGGSTDATDQGAVSAGSYAGRWVAFGPREQGMAACANGLALHGGLVPLITASLALSDPMRRAIRSAAMMHLRIVMALTDDSIGLGADGPALQPVEQLAGLRAMPNVQVLRPADAVETAECWELALRRSDGPSVLALCRQDVPAWRSDTAENRCARGAYVLAEASGPRRATLIASGSEVELAMAARDLLAADGVPVSVVSLPCWDLFALQADSYRDSVLGAAPRFGIEAACGFGWERWLGPDGVFLGMSGYGASAPAEDLYRHFGLTPDAIVSAVKKRLGS